MSKEYKYNEAIPIKVLDDNGKIIGRFDSISEYRRKFHCHRLDGFTLDKLRNNEVVNHQGRLICKRSVKTSYLHLELRKLKTKKKGEEVTKKRKENLKKLSKTVLVFDYEYNLVNTINDKTLKEIGEMYNRKEGSIKSSLSRGFEYYKNTRTKLVSEDSLYFIYLKDVGK